MKKNFIAGDDGDQNYGDHPNSDHSGDDDRKDDDNNLDRFPASLAKANGLGTPTNNTLIATKQVKNFMDGAGIKEIWTSGRLCDAEVFFHFPENISILVGKLQKFPN